MDILYSSFYNEYHIVEYLSNGPNVVADLCNEFGIIKNCYNKSSIVETIATAI